jgi:uncharacterized protein (TIGR00730 family)
MIDQQDTGKPLPLCEEDYPSTDSVPETPQTLSPTYIPAYADQEFLRRDELRAVRFQLELMKPDLLQREQNIKSTVVVFGSTRIKQPEEARKHLEAARAAAAADPDNQDLQQKLRISESLFAKSHYYDKAKELGHLIAIETAMEGNCEAVVVTGGGPGIMEAANRGSFEAGGKSIGLNIILPREQYPNQYITPELCFQFQYFALRKLHFLLRATALVVFPGGYGTLDELFETLTLIQTQKMAPLPILLFGREYWNKIINFQALVHEGTISQQDFKLVQFVESPLEAWKIIKEFRLDRETSGTP